LVPGDCEGGPGSRAIPGIHFVMTSRAS
jgi:hypothetical protein